MASDTAQLVAQALKLPPRLRVELGYDLVLSLTDENLDPSERTSVDDLRTRFGELRARFAARAAVPFIISWKTRGTLRRIGPGMEPPEGPGAEEIRRRVGEVHSGAAELIPAEQVFAEMRARFG